MKNIRFIVLLILSFTLITGKVEANQDVSMKQYSVKPIFDELQKEGVMSYFHFQLESGSTYDSSLMFEVENKTASPISIDVNVLDAISSPQGVIQYTLDLEDVNYKLTDESKKLTNFSVAKQTVVISPKDITYVEVPVNVTGLEGDLIGGVSFTLTEEGETSNDGNNQFQILNELKTVIAVVIQTSKEYSIKDLKVGEPFVNTMPSYYAIRLPLENTSNVLIENLKLSYEILDEKGKSLFKSKEDMPLTITPKTKLNLPINWNYPTITKNSEYTLKARIEFDDGESYVDINKKFNLTGKETVYGMDVDGNVPVELEPEGNPIKKYVLMAIALLLVVVGIYLLIDKRLNKTKKFENESPTEV